MSTNSCVRCSIFAIVSPQVNLYIIRHGESIDAVAGLNQRSDSGLSEMGLKQAGALAERLSKIQADLVLASPFARTKQTAEIVAKRLGKQIEYSDLLVEERMPSEIVGKRSLKPDILRIRRSLWDNFADPNWKFSDWETFFELRSRAGKAIKYLTGLTDENVILVTHGAFTAMLLCVMWFGETVEPTIYQKFRNFFWDHNTGITWCVYDGKKWKMLTWNDYAHLG